MSASFPMSIFVWSTVWSSLFIWGMSWRESVAALNSWSSWLCFRINGEKVIRCSFYFSIVNKVVPVVHRHQYFPYKNPESSSGWKRGVGGRRKSGTIKSGYGGVWKLRLKGVNFPIFTVLCVRINMRERTSWIYCMTYRFSVGGVFLTNLMVRVFD